MPVSKAPASGTAPIAGVLLAAGTSSRMGSNKMLFELEGESLLRRAARRALAGGLSPLLVVLGHQVERAAQELEGLDCRTVINPDYEQGISSSLKAGVAAVSELMSAAAVVMLADMPFVTPEMIAGLIARYRATTAPLVISVYRSVNGEDGVAAPPMLYDRALFAEIQEMAGGRCGKQVVKRHRAEAEVLEWPAAALADLDVPEDYARVTGGHAP
jgi:molybdenum cofactor cytidylyltransferase